MTFACKLLAYNQRVKANIKGRKGMLTMVHPIILSSFSDMSMLQGLM